MAISNEDYVKAGKILSVEPATVRAIATVESNGSGFAKNGKPTILFERHIFYKELLNKRNKELKASIKRDNPTLRDIEITALTAAGLRKIQNDLDSIARQKPNICNKATGGYMGGISEYNRLEIAKSIDEECALRSCSWGAFQIMGFHAENLGYKNVFELVDRAQSETGQLELFVRFIQKNPQLLKAMRAKNWNDFARYYNGPQYQKNSYNIKMAAAYNKYKSDNSLA